MKLIRTIVAATLFALAPNAYAVDRQQDIAAVAKHIFVNYYNPGSFECKSSVGKDVVCISDKFRYELSHIGNEAMEKLDADGDGSYFSFSRNGDFERYELVFSKNSIESLSRIERVLVAGNDEEKKIRLFYRLGYAIEPSSPEILQSSMAKVIRDIRGTLQIDTLLPELINEKNAFQKAMLAFAESVRINTEFLDGMGDLERKVFLKEYPYLDTCSLTLGIVTSDIGDPEVINKFLKSIKNGMMFLPIHLQEMYGEVSYFLTTGTGVNDFCSQDAIACYDPENDTLCFNATQALEYRHRVHEAVHPLAKRISSGVFDAALQSLVLDAKIQNELEFKKDGNPYAWKTGPQGPKYFLPRPYAAKNPEELKAVYVEDIYSNHGKIIESLLAGSSRDSVIFILEGLKVNGYLGHDGGSVLAPIYASGHVRQSEKTFLQELNRLNGPVLFSID